MRAYPSMAEQVGTRNRDDGGDDDSDIGAGAGGGGGLGAGVELEAESSDAGRRCGNWDVEMDVQAPSEAVISEFEGWTH